MAERDGTHPDPEHPSVRRYIGGQRIYFHCSRPWERASTIVGNTNVTDPRLIDAGQVSAARRASRLNTRMPPSGSDVGLPLPEEEMKGDG